LLAFPAEAELLKSEPLSTATALQRLPEGAIAFRLAVDRYPDDAPMLALGRQLLLALIGGTFGETYDTLPADRSLSSVEDSVSEFLLQQLFLNLFNSTWPNAEPLRLSIVSKGAPKTVCALPLNELIVAATISVSGAFGPQPLFLLLPRKGIMEQLIQPVQEPIEVNAADRQLMESLVREMPVDLAVVLGSAEVTLTQLALLHEGDVVVLEQKVSEPLNAKVGGANKFQVWPGVVGRRQAVQIESTVSE
jgi:flagellar motor switch protein FliM